jgi:TonB family protein
MKRFLLSITAVLFIGISAAHVSAQGSTPAVPSHTVFVPIEKEPIALTPVQDLIQFPTNAPDNVTQSKVVLQMLIDTFGNVRKVSIAISGGAAFDTAARQAAMRAKFTPAAQNGKPVRVWLRDTVVFRKPTSTSAQPSSDSDPDPGDFIDVEKEPVPLTPLGSLFKFPIEAPDSVTNVRVEMRLLIDKSGNVQRVEIDKSGGEIFDEAAIAGGKLATFSPAIANGKPIKIWLEVPVIFKRPN